MTLQLVKPAQCTFGELECGEKFHLETDRVQARQQILVKVTDTEARLKFRSYGKYNVPADTQVVRVKSI